MATKTQSTEVSQQKKVYVKSEEALNEMKENGQLEPFTDYYTEEHNTNALYKNYPINSLYISTNSISPADSVENGGLGGGIWEQLPEGLALWTTQQEIFHEGTSNQNDLTATPSRIINAGLPNISTSGVTTISAWSIGGNQTVGVFRTHGRAVGYAPASSGEYGAFYGLGFDASRDNPIYGNANTVQPPAYRVYAWKRVG